MLEDSKYAVHGTVPKPIEVQEVAFVQAVSAPCFCDNVSKHVALTLTKTSADRPGKEIYA